MAKSAYWPALPLEAWQDTYDTLHLWTQIVGKVPLKLSPRVNHWWQVAFLVDPRGLHTYPIPYGHRTFELRFDFTEHFLSIQTSDHQYRSMALAPRTVRDFYLEFMDLLASLGLRMEIDRLPKEIPNPIPFDEDVRHSAYDRHFAHDFWRALVQVDRLLKIFRADFIGKSSPVHFFWGSFDLAVSRFSGRRAPPRPGADLITREGYSHEVSSAGFWPGSGNVRGPAFYAYVSPEPEGYSTTSRILAPAFYNPPTHGWILMYDQVRLASDPERMALDFFRSAYEAAADLAGWDREALERRPPQERKAA